MMDEHIYRLPSYKPRYESQIPKCTPNFEEISKQMRINADIVMKEISEHVNSEIERFKKEINELNIKGG